MQGRSHVIAHRIEGCRMNKVFVIGLDCAEPTLVFDRWRDQLPNLSRLRPQCVHGNLASCTPAIPVPAVLKYMGELIPADMQGKVIEA
jgi:predicted AlkP superfamily phosphohydrolase/phosphomutase